MSESDTQDSNLKWQKNILMAVFEHLPVGFNKNFNMIACMVKANKLNKVDADSSEIWNRLRSLYNLELLDQIHKLPFPNHEKDFDLSENNDFKELIENLKQTHDKSLSEELPTKFEEASSDDNTLSGASTPVTVTPQVPVIKERKRKSAHSSDVNVEKTTPGPGRRRDRSDSEKTEKSETKHTPRHRHEKHHEEHSRLDHKTRPSSTPHHQNSSHKDHHHLSTPKRGRGNPGKRLRGSRETSVSVKSNKKPRIRRDVD